MKKIFYAILFSTICNITYSQKTDPTSTLVYTIDSVTGGSSKDLFINFMQLGYNNLTRGNHEFNFTTNPYAVMLRSNPDLNKDDSYTRYRNLRRLNLGFGLKLDSTYKFNGFSSGIKYSILDKSDFSTSSIAAIFIKKNKLNQERLILHRKLNELRDKIDSPKAKGAFQEKINSLFGANNSDVKLISFSNDFQDMLITIIKENQLDSIKKYFVDSVKSFYQINETIVETIKENIKTAPLWTIGVSDSTYNNRPVFSNVVFVTEFTKGIFNPQPLHNNFELNLKATLDLMSDTLKKNSAGVTKDNLQRAVFNTEGGLNWVVRDHQSEKSYFEFKLAWAYGNILNPDLYQNEARQTYMINATPRLRIFNDIWIPLEIKWNYKTGSVNGNFSIKSNFTGLASLLKEKS